jgi:hypothetical protein
MSLYLVAWTSVVCEMYDLDNWLKHSYYMEITECILFKHINNDNSACYVTQFVSALNKLHIKSRKIDYVSISSCTFSCVWNVWSWHQIKIWSLHGNARMRLTQAWDNDNCMWYFMQFVTALNILHCKPWKIDDISISSSMAFSCTWNVWSTQQIKIQLLQGTARMGGAQACDNR